MIIIPKIYPQIYDTIGFMIKDRMIAKEIPISNPVPPQTMKRKKSNDRYGPRNLAIRRSLLLFHSEILFPETRYAVSAKSAKGESDFESE